jgi:beta-lactam-binding protein with PASTA domain/tRNA A-37 threonylcarbamoyl transferase component Bud32
VCPTAPVVGTVGAPGDKHVTTTVSCVALSRLSDRIGQVLSDRYRLLAPIGTGASASVYLADDVTLRRRVAVKILHDALAGDDGFLRRFRAEAQAAAALNHPNIMAVFDWGHDDVPFLVTEYLGGGSLRTMLDHHQRLTPAQALMIGLDASRGLDYAHRRGFVHRDIKPANLLFDEEARLRIADFGLARALAEAAWTEPQGAVLGTARYASPEQARGETLDGRSDVYSLGLVIIEAVTGSVPFAGDTTIGTLMARVDVAVRVPLSLGALLPALEAAGVPQPADRPDAAEFTRLLMIAAEQLDRPEPLLLAGSMAHDHDVVADRDPTVMRHPEAEPDIMSAPPGTVIDGIRVIPDPATSVVFDADHHLDDQPGSAAGGGLSPAGASDGEPLSRHERRLLRREQRAAAAATVGSLVISPSVAADGAAGSAPSTAAPFDGASDLGIGAGAGPALTIEADGGHRRRWLTVLLSILLVAALATGSFGYWYREIRVVTHPVPTLVGTNVSSLDTAISGDGWTLQRTDVAQVDTAPGQILAQDPAAGTALREGAALAITVSTGPPPIPVPTDLAGQTLTAATAELAALDLTVGDVTRQFDEKAGKDIVLARPDGAPTELAKGGAVSLVVSDGPRPRVVPDIPASGDPTAMATALSVIGLKSATTPGYSDTVPEGQVISISPGAGTSVARGSTVTITVSQGPKPIIVPPVVGLSVTDAANKLQAAGLTVSGTQGSPLGKVTGTNPAAGTSVKKNTSVVIITG